mgnify:FL=1
MRVREYERASSVFVANRTLAFTNKSDTNFSPIYLANNEVNRDKKLTTTSVLGLLTRKAFYREGLGSVLALRDDDVNKTYLAPKRALADNTTPFPYGNAAQNDSVLNNIDYSNLNETLDILFDSVNQTRAAVVVYKNKIIAERYANGFNQN